MRTYLLYLAGGYDVSFLKNEALNSNQSNKYQYIINIKQSLISMHSSGRDIYEVSYPINS